MKNKTVVEWLVDQVNTDCLDPIYIRKELIEQANAMFEEQIIKSFEIGYENGACVNEENIFYHGNNYYNATFKGGDNE